MSIKHLSPKSKEDIIKYLEEGMLDKQHIKVIKMNDQAYQFVQNYTQVGEDKLPGKIALLNGLCEIIRELKDK